MFKTLTTRDYCSPDGTYTTLEGWYCTSGDFTATPLQMGYAKEKTFGELLLAGIIKKEEIQM